MDLLEDALGRVAVVVVERERREERDQLIDSHSYNLGDILATDLHI